MLLCFLIPDVPANPADVNTAAVFLAAPTPTDFAANNRVKLGIFLILCVLRCWIPIQPKPSAILGNIQFGVKT
jgi:hypothetical protein